MRTIRKRTAVLATVTGLVLLGAGITTATGPASAGQGKVFVCKYVGQPNVDERLQTGQNPISVAVSAIPGPGPVEVGSSFADAQGRSYVLAFDVGQPEPDVRQCPAPQGPPQPAAKVTTTTKDAISCTEYSVRTITTTTEYVLEGGEWVLGEPVVTTGAWVNSTPTAEQIKAAGLVCSVIVVPTEATSSPTESGVTVLGTSAAAVPTKAPKATTTKAPVSVLGTSATANPLPAGAQAGLADTSGQVIVGSLAAFAGLLMLGSAFLIRRRHGVV